MLPEFKDRTKQQYIYELTSFGGTILYFLVSLFFLVLENYTIFFNLLVGIILIYTSVIIIKIFYFKDRPKKYKYGNFVEKIDASSFPSVHAARITLLSVILMNYFNNIMISAILAALIILVACSRIMLKKHDIKDVGAGIILGIVIYFIIQFTL